MLKKAGFVAATAAGLTMLGGTAFAADSEPEPAPAPYGDVISFDDAYHTFITGGGAAGYGVASLVAGAYTGVITSMDPFLNSVEDAPLP